MSGDSTDAYSPTADKQLDELETGRDPDLYNSILDTVEAIFDLTSEAQKMSTAIQTEAGRIVFRLPVAGRHPYKVFWTRTDDGPRIEAIFPHP